MASERSQILALFAAGRIDFVKAERLLCLVGGRNRFATLAPWVLLLLVAWDRLPLLHATETARSALRSATRSEVFQHLQLFLNRFPGELP